MTKTTFISGCDANYYPMLREWVDSVRRHPQSEGIDINILDAGLTEAQKEELRPLVSSIVNPDWPCELPTSKTEGKEYLKGCVCRPFIPQMFPGYDRYVWMDADTWVQNWDGVELFLKGTAKKKIALTGNVDRAYPKAVRVKWLGKWPWKVRNFYFSNALKAFDFKTAKALLPHHTLLAGMFALDADAPHWARWQALVVEALQKGKVFTAEQLCLGVMCYLEGFEFEILPAWSHWLCEYMPLWDEAQSMFVEPYLPHMPLGVLHLSGHDEMRVDRNITVGLDTLGGGRVEKCLRYPHFDGAKKS